MTELRQNKSTTDRSQDRGAQALKRLVGPLQQLSPGLAARLAEPAFLWPRRHTRPAHEQAAFASARRSSVRYRGVRVPVYRWGSGPTVLFAHGWEGRATQVAPLLPALLEAGFEVVAYDVPGHGEAPRALVSVVDFARVAERVARALDTEVHAAIGHSVGGTALVMAAARTRFTSRLVTLGSPRSPRPFLTGFSRLLALSPTVHAALVARLDARYGLAFTELDTTEAAQRARASGLIVHDRDDGEVPFVHGEQLASAWPDATLLSTRGLGHRRILRDPAVIAAVTEFVARGERRVGIAESITRELYDRDLRLLIAS